MPAGGFMYRGSHRTRSSFGLLRDVAPLAVARAELRIPLLRASVAAAARRADQHAVALLQDVLLPMIDRFAVELHVAEPPVGAARETRRGVHRPLRHEARDDRARGLALEQDVLAESAAKLSGAPRAGPHALVAYEQRTVPLGHFHRRR